MSSGVGLRGGEATLVSPTTTADMQRVAESKPSSVELIGDWSDLSVLAEIAAGVKRLYIAGDLERGRIKGLSGLGQFTELTHLRLASTVKGGYDVGCLPSLESLEITWQTEAAAAFCHPNLRSLTIKSLPSLALSETVDSHHSRLERLWLSMPKFDRISDSFGVANVRELRITDAKKLTSLGNMSLPHLLTLDIENARSLVDVSAIVLSPKLHTLRLNSIGDAADLSVLARLSRLHHLQVGGQRGPNMNWFEVVRMPSLQKVFAWWNPAVVNEDMLRESAASVGRELRRFEPVAGRGVRPLLVELA